MLKIILRKIHRILSDIKYSFDLRQHAKHLPALSPQDRAIVEACRKEGTCVTSLEALGLPSTEMLEEAKELLVDMQAVLARRTNLKTWGTCENPAYPQIFTVTDLPVIADWAQNQRLLNIIENYIGLPVAFQGVHLRRDFANEHPVTTEFWHRDLEDRRVIKLFVYLSDVATEAGPYEYIPRSKVTPAIVRQIETSFKQRVASNPYDMGLIDDEMAAIVPRSDWHSCEGPTGTAVFSDSVAVFHHGKSRQQGRSALFFVYTAKNPLRPQDCTQYSDRTYARPEQLQPQT
ncbi:phytanoyl-CoA dioxygenase [Stenomitos frigidus]|uniref:Phytanoyl-CoA dioxygenase n=1 Tax=Stenomitos frigidus ULC18 TaxID=2107698 RepID=A0A2T1E980_9CYAN|nr:phytanoyl-CoA dioxygenase [Stenomitos frigidus]PSB29273.1 phytanoyl-CoA dioxygenase [Stenomitos frigidus ULC18]